MTPPPTRPAALLAGLALALAGCGQSPPAAPTGDPPAEPKRATPAPAALAGPGDPPPAAAPAFGEVQPTAPSRLAAENFLNDLRAAGGPPPPDLLNRVSPGFRKVIGKPILTPADAARGYRTDTALGWLGRIGAGLGGVGVPTGYAGPGPAAVFVGPTHTGTGRLLLRMVQADGDWKVDWLQLGAAQPGEPAKPANPDEAFTDFAAVAFLDALTGGAMPREDRIPLVAALLAPELRTAWAEPFTQDRNRGYDYNPGKLGQLIDSLGGGATGYTRTRTGPATFRVEVLRYEGPRVFALTLVKGPGPGEWLVGEFRPQ